MIQNPITPRNSDTPERFRHPVFSIVIRVLDEERGLDRLGERACFNTGLFAWYGSKSLGVAFDLPDREDQSPPRWRKQAGNSSSKWSSDWGGSVLRINARRHGVPSAPR